MFKYHDLFFSVAVSIEAVNLKLSNINFLIFSSRILPKNFKLTKISNLKYNLKFSIYSLKETYWLKYLSHLKMLKHMATR